MQNPTKAEVTLFSVASQYANNDTTSPELHNTAADGFKSASYSPVSICLAAGSPLMFIDRLTVLLGIEPLNVAQDTIMTIQGLFMVRVRSVVHTPGMVDDN